MMSLRTKILRSKYNFFIFWLTFGKSKEFLKVFRQRFDNKTKKIICYIWKANFVCFFVLCGLLLNAQSQSLKLSYYDKFVSGGCKSSQAYTGLYY